MATTALALVLTAPEGAGAAAISVDRACYPANGNQLVTVTGEGFTPGVQYQLLVQAGVDAVDTAAADGTVRKTFAVPIPPESGPGAHEAAYTVAVAQGALSASTTFRSAQTFGDFNPGDGDPRRLRVRFTAYGFGVATPAGQPMPEVFVHYVDPRRKVRRTISLGRGAAPCGTIKRTALRKLFPFAPRSGTWGLQFDTQRTYHRGTDNSRFLFDRPTLTVSAAG